VIDCKDPLMKFCSEKAISHKKRSLVALASIFHLSAEFRLRMYTSWMWGIFFTNPYFSYPRSCQVFRRVWKVLWRQYWLFSSYLLLVN